MLVGPELEDDVLLVLANTVLDTGPGLPRKLVESAKGKLLPLSPRMRLAALPMPPPDDETLLKLWVGLIEFLSCSFSVTNLFTVMESRAISDLMSSLLSINFCTLTSEFSN